MKSKTSRLYLVVILSVACVVRAAYYANANASAGANTNVNSYPPEMSNNDTNNPPINGPTNTPNENNTGAPNDNNYPPSSNTSNPYNNNNNSNGGPNTNNYPPSNNASPPSYGKILPKKTTTISDIAQKYKLDPDQELALRAAYSGLKFGNKFGGEIFQEVGEDAVKAKIRGIINNKNSSHFYNPNANNYGNAGYNNYGNYYGYAGYSNPQSPQGGYNYNYYNNNNGYNNNNNTSNGYNNNGYYTNSANGANTNPNPTNPDCTCSIGKPSTETTSNDWGISSFFSSKPNDSTNANGTTSNPTNSVTMKPPNVTDQLVNRRGPFSYPQVFLESFDEKPLPPPKGSIGLSL